MKGIYIMANDLYYDQFVAFINSYKTFNDLPLIIIPYSDNCKRLKQLTKNITNISWFNNDDTLKQCDAIGKQIYGKEIGMFRKLACWEGPFQNFIYVDIDTVVQDDFNTLNIDTLLQQHQYISNYSYVDHMMQWVWNIDQLDYSLFPYEYYQYSANMGFLISTKDFLSIEYCKLVLPIMLKYRHMMNLTYIDQPFFNFLFCLKYKQLSSLNKINDNTLPIEFWYGISGGRIKEGKLYFNDGNYKDKKPFIVHWAGVNLVNPTPDIQYIDLWYHYHNGGKLFTSVMV